jgi:DNA-binding transcriptional ArsR family regulator
MVDERRRVRPLASGPDGAVLDAVFHALADPTRRAMLQSLARGDRTVSELAAPHHMTLAAASKHVASLERAGLLSRSVHGRIHVCRLQPGGLARANRWLTRYERFWTASLDALDALLRTERADRPRRRVKKGTH